MKKLLQLFNFCLVFFICVGGVFGNDCPEDHEISINGMLEAFYSKPISKSDDEDFPRNKYVGTNLEISTEHRHRQDEDGNNFHEVTVNNVPDVCLNLLDEKTEIKESGEAGSSVQSEVDGYFKLSECSDPKKMFEGSSIEFKKIKENRKFTEDHIKDICSDSKFNFDGDQKDYCFSYLSPLVGSDRKCQVLDVRMIQTIIVEYSEQCVGKEEGDCELSHSKGSLKIKENGSENKFICDELSFSKEIDQGYFHGGQFKRSGKKDDFRKCMVKFKKMERFGTTGDSKQKCIDFFMNEKGNQKTFSFNLGKTNPEKIDFEDVIATSSDSTKCKEKKFAEYQMLEDSNKGNVRLAFLDPNNPDAQKYLSNGNEDYHIADKCPAIRPIWDVKSENLINSILNSTDKFGKCSTDEQIRKGLDNDELLEEDQKEMKAVYDEYIKQKNRFRGNLTKNEKIEKKQIIKNFNSIPRSTIENVIANAVFQYYSAEEGDDGENQRKMARKIINMGMEIKEIQDRKRNTGSASFFSRTDNVNNFSPGLCEKRVAAYKNAKELCEEEGNGGYKHTAQQLANLIATTDSEDEEINEDVIDSDSWEKKESSEEYLTPYGKNGSGFKSEFGFNPYVAELDEEDDLPHLYHMIHILEQRKEALTAVCESYSNDIGKSFASKDYTGKKMRVRTSTSSSSSSEEEYYSNQQVSNAINQGMAQFMQQFQPMLNLIREDYQRNLILLQEQSMMFADRFQSMFREVASIAKGSIFGQIMMSRNMAESSLQSTKAMVGLASGMEGTEIQKYLQSSLSGFNGPLYFDGLDFGAGTNYGTVQNYQLQNPGDVPWESRLLGGIGTFANGIDQVFFQGRNQGQQDA